MAKAKGKKSKSSRSKVKVRDLKPRKNAKGGKVTMHDISITRPVDKSSTNL